MPGSETLTKFFLRKNLKSSTRYIDRIYINKIDELIFRILTEYNCQSSTTWYA